MVDSFYSEKELSYLGLKYIGDNVKISRKSSFYNVSEIEIGDNVRVDDFCILSGNIKIGSFVHLSAYVALYGNSGIEICSYSGVSAHSVIYSEVDDFTQRCLIGPMYSYEQRCLKRGKVILKEYTQVGAHCVVMPGVMIAEGGVVGAMSFVNHDLLSPWSVYAGIPVRKIKERM